MKFTQCLLPLAATLTLSAGAAFGQAGQTIRIAHIDPFSGPFANVAQNQLKSWQFIADEIGRAHV